MHPEQRLDMQPQRPTTEAATEAAVETAGMGDLYAAIPPADSAAGRD